VQNARNTDLFRKQSGPKGPGFACPLRGLQWSFPRAAVCCSDGALQNAKFQVPHLRVSGVRQEKQNR